MIDFIKRFIKSEIFLYLFIGFLTTVINVLVFEILRRALNVNSDGGIAWKVAEVISFIVAVVFAFFANKLVVFKSSDMSFSVIGKEITSFFTARVITEVINIIIMWYMIDLKNCNELFTKIIASIVVIVLNYIFSKFIIFKK